MTGAGLRWWQVVESLVAKGRSTAARRTADSRLRSFQKFVDVTGLQSEPPACRVAAYITAMVMQGGGLTDEERTRFMARGPGEPGAGRKGTLSLAMARSYMGTLACELGVPVADLAGVLKGLEATRWDRCEPIARVEPLDVMVVTRILADLSNCRLEEPEMLTAGALAWAGVLRMADLDGIRARDVVVEEGTQTVRIVWWETKEAQLRSSEVPMRYALSPVPLTALTRCLSKAGDGPLLPKGCTRRLLAAATARRRLPTRGSGGRCST